MCQLLEGIRIEAGLTQVQMATRVGYSPDHLAVIERGHSPITQAILDGYGALVDERRKTEKHEGHS